MNRSECPPQEVGVDPVGLGRVTELVASRATAAQVCVLRHGRVVLDRAYGCDPDALFWTFSAGKPFTALLVHLLAQRGELSLDDPVARYWPRFGDRGKGAVTVRQVLQHRSGMATGGSLLTDALAMTDWDRSVRVIERARLRWPPGQVPAYQAIIYGFILGELVRRVTGLALPDVLRGEFLDPLGLRDVHMGLPDGMWHRRVPVSSPGAVGLVTRGALNRRATRRAVIPSGGVSATAADLARFYQALLREGELDGVRILDAATVREARRVSSDDEIDRAVKLPIRWAQGFQLGGTGTHPDRKRPMGQLSDRETFGHNGSNCCLAWADPSRDVVFVYLTNRLTGGHEGARHQSAVSDALLAACA
ncbi:serine hydrolase domain-containing protein [Streptomyces sp. NPDC059788]|uniref:serine hydrolase domain-containing protein n=1 Tax=Streptomyces sp. NPDC059788 TaxID=3346948 RepID=UPI003666BD90